VGGGNGFCGAGVVPGILELQELESSFGPEFRGLDLRDYRQVDLVGRNVYRRRLWSGYGSGHFRECEVGTGVESEVCAETVPWRATFIRSLLLLV
jgi:hypothetical protein